MKRLLFMVALAALAGCQLQNIEIGNGNSIDTEINVGDFDAIVSHGSLDIIYTQMEGKPEVTLTCDENLIKYYRIGVEGGSLVVNTKNNVIIRPKVKSVLTVNSPVLNGVSVSGSGDCLITTPLACDGDFNFRVSGSGGIKAEGIVECDDFSSTISGSGKINISGVLADAAKFRVTGSGSTHVDLLTSANVSATISGSGSVQLVCKDAGDIDVSISGSGGVRLKGNARSLKSSTSGSGRVNSNDLILEK